MENKLYVGNLSDDVGVESLRRRFAEFGEVSDVQVAADHASGRMRGHAFVKMATAAGAQLAIARLNGTLFNERPLRVSVAGQERDRTRTKVIDPARITSQFRERFNMVYELDCTGVPLAVKVFREDVEVETYRIEVTAKGAAGAEGMSVTASAGTRALALEAVAEIWTEKSTESTKFVLDWPAITKALAAVRAI
jgi:RNA recognition motif-containing protein